MKKNRLAEFIKHAVDEEAYGNSLVFECKGKFKELYERILDEIKRYPYISSKEKYNIIKEKIDEYIVDFNSEFVDWLDDSFEAIVDTEAAWLVSFMAISGVSYTVAKNLVSKVKFMPVAENNSYLGTGEAVIKKLSQNVNTALKNAYLTKESTEIIADRFESRYEKYENNLDTEVSTFNTAVFRNTDTEIFKSNNETVRYSAVLDSRTCLSCAEYHGQIFSAVDAPIPPFHFGCRCQLIPASLFSDSEVNTFSDWIETLTEDEKLDYLGKGRYQLYKSGVPVTRFVDNGRILTLDELNDNSIN